KVNWFQEMTNGERVVGPMTLFNAQLFFSSYAPPGSTSHACSAGTSKVWGVDYVRPLGFASQASPPRNRGGEARLPNPSGGFLQSLTAQAVAGSSDAVIFGVSVAQEPTCSTNVENPQNDFLGYGATQAITNINPGRFQLVMHVGGVENTGAAGDLQANVKTVNLQSPGNATRVDSWAALVE
ncbi:MAG TPA: hypothetical protein VFQ61_27580, partial [Polyangiaceae bacterium]|nr:hypothetical protein [Polyangiaceae bacterium]